VAGAQDVVVGDENGVLFLPSVRAADVATAARAIRDSEHDQAERLRQGTSLRVQLRFAEFVSRRSANPELTFRQHLGRIGGAIEE
jgi:hypothetical protein